MKLFRLQESIRTLGYQLACRELYGENTPDYYRQQKHHDYLLSKLYRLQKITG
jgi:hypothetical protein